MFKLVLVSPLMVLHCIGYLEKITEVRCFFFYLNPGRLCDDPMTEKQYVSWLLPGIGLPVAVYLTIQWQRSNMLLGCSLA